MTRRGFLGKGVRVAGAALIAPALPGLWSGLAGCGDAGGGGLADPRPGVDFPAYATTPFTLGVASGDPTADGFVLWTRLALDPLATETPGGLTADDVPVYWEVAEDDTFAHLVARGVATAEARYAHSVHVTVGGLDPDRWYAYRLEVGAHASAVGRARTLPPAGAHAERFVLAATSCQKWSDGYYASHRHLAAESDLDLVVFLGDYIYEYGDADDDVRHNGTPSPHTLTEYRLRYAQYKADADLQAAHQRCPWVVIWDDHEVEDGYAGGTTAAANAPLYARRVAAYQAYWEHMPLRGGPPVDGALQIYRDLVVGDLAQLFLLDTRQFRSPLPCGQLGSHCDELDTTDILGPPQEAWLVAGLGSATARWKVLGNQVVFTPLPIVPFEGSEALFNYDQWDGYPRSREAVLDAIRAHDVDNVLIVTGDVDSLGLGRVHDVGDDVTTPVLATEIVAPSVTSDASSVAAFEDRITAIPWVDAFSVTVHGYARLTLSHTDARVAFMVLADHTDPDSAQVVHSRWVIADGVGGAQPDSTRG